MKFQDALNNILQNKIDEFNLYDEKIDDKQTALLANVLQNNHSLTKLNLHSNQVGAAGASALANALQNNHSLTFLSLDSNQVGAAGASALANAIQNNHSLTNLDLWNNQVGDAGASALANALQNNHSLTELSLGRNQLSAAGASALANALQNNHSLTSLYLQCNKVGAAGASALANALQNNHSLTDLSLNSNQVGAAGASALANALQNNHSLTNLDLWNNQVGAAGASALANAIQYNHSLTTLYLRENKVGDAGASALAIALQNNHSLTKLNLEENQVGAAGASALAIALQNNQSLTLLDLHYNQVGDAGASALANAIQNNHSLTILSLGWNQVGDAGASALAKALQNNHSLTSLSLGKNGVGAAGASALANALQNNHSLTNLDLGRNQVDYAADGSFYEAWKAHKNRCQLVQKAAEAGNEQALIAYFNQYQQFPPTVLSLLIQHHQALVMQWETYWSSTALNYQDDQGNTPLHHAIQLKANNLIAWLLIKSASLTRCNKNNQSPSTLLKSANLLNDIGPTENYNYIVGACYFSGQGAPINRIKAHGYYEKASKENYKPANWLLNLLNLLDEKTYIESMVIGTLIVINEPLPKLTLDEMQTLILSIATPEGKLLSILTQQDYNLYHLAAYLGSLEWLEALQNVCASPTSHISSQLILMKNRQGLRPSALARQQAKFIAEHKDMKFSSPEAAQDEILSKYRACELALRQIEEKTQLDLILLNQRNQQHLRLNYEGRAQALKDNIDLLIWQPEKVNQVLIRQYAKVLQQVWSAREICTILSNQLRGQLIWPEGFDPFALTSPAQTLNQFIENPPSSWTALLYKVQGPMAYAHYLYGRAVQWLKLYESNLEANFSSQEAHNEGKVALKQLVKAYQSYEDLWKKATSNDDKEWLRSTPVLLLQAGKTPIFITPLIAEGKTLSPAVKLSYFLNKGEKIEDMAGAGTAPVFSIRGVHYKRNPHAPGIEFMVSSLSKVLAGEGATPTELMKVIGPDGIPYAYQASHTVQGKDLQSVLIHHPECMDKIRLDNFAAVVVLGMLTDPQDGKPDNYMVEFSQDEQGNITQIDILGIDNDIAFSDVIISQHKKGEKAGQYMMNIKNALYFFPQMMQSIDAGFRDKLLEKQPEFILLEWLQLLLARNKEYEALLTEGVFTLAEYSGDGRTSKRGLQLPIKVVAGTMARIYRKLKQLHAILNEQPNITLWNLLMEVEPEVGTHYVKVKAEYPHENFGCDVMKCIKALYEENVTNGKELMWFRAQLDAGYTHTMTSLVLRTAEEFGFEDNRTTSLKDSVINVLKCLAYEDFKGMLAPVLYRALEALMQEAELKDLLTTALAHNCVNCLYWLWQDSVIELSIIQQACENLKKYSLLHFFAQNKHLAGVKVLLTQSVYPVNICNSQGYTPLHMAASVGDSAIVEYLVENKAYVNAKTTLGKTALMMAESRCKQMNAETPQKGDKKYADIIAYLKRAACQPIKKENNKTHPAMLRP